MRIKNIMKGNKILLIGFFSVISLTLLVRFFIFSPIFSPRMINTEWNTATVLRHLQIWEQTSPWNYIFNPVVTYQTPANKFIDNHASTEEGFLIYEGKDNNYYYTSYPQFGYIAPYIFFKILFLKPSLVGLRLFGILIQICTAFFVYKILTNITKKKIIGFVGFASYMLQPIGLHYYPNNYMSDMLVPLFFVSTIYFLLKIVHEKEYTKTTAVLFVLSMFLMIYTEYIGLFLVGIIFLYALIYRRTCTKFLLWTTFLIPPITMSLIILQYALVGDLNSFWAVMVDRYTRSYESQSISEAVRTLFLGYWKWYAPSLILIGGFALLKLFSGLIASQKEYELSVLEKSKIGVIAVIPILVIFIHHGILLHWTSFHAQYFSTLKTAASVSIGIGLLVWVLLYRTHFQYMRTMKIFVVGMFIVCELWSIKVYKETLVYNVSPYAYCDVGEAMSTYVEANQIIFVKDSRLERHEFPINPVIVSCAGRNIAIYTNKQEAKDLLEKNKVTAGVIFTLTYFDYGSVAITKIEDISSDK
jgi:hypothetical protein